MDHYYDDIPDNEFQKIFVKGVYTSREEAVRASSEFVRFLTEMR
jgi:hypothetical protein